MSLFTISRPIPLDAPVTIATLGLPESGALPRPPDEVDSNVMIVFSLRALCTCDLEQPVEQPTSPAISLCWYPMTSCMKKSFLLPAGNLRIARMRFSLSTSLPGIFKQTQPTACPETMSCFHLLLTPTVLHLTAHLLIL